MNEYLVTLKNIKYKNQFTSFLKFHNIPFEYLNDTQIYVVKINGICANIIRSFYYVKAVSKDTPIPSFPEPPISPTPINILSFPEDYTNSYTDSYDWGVYKIKAPNLWKKGFFGQGVNVALLDTGVAEHIGLFLKKRLSFSDDVVLANDTNGHGTMVAGIIACRPDRAKLSGVAYKCNLYSLKVVDKDNDLDPEAVVKALEWCIDNGIKIVNMSLGYRQCFDNYSDIVILEKAINKAISRGIIIVAASGNSNLSYNMPAPASFDNVLAIGATDIEDTRWVDLPLGSNYGPRLNFMAPGVKITSTYLKNGYGTGDGTSYAAPHVTGLIALLLSENPNRTYSDILKILKDNALLLPVSSPNKDQYANGLVQAPN